jgi:hypothetical protein
MGLKSRWARSRVKMPDLVGDDFDILIGGGSSAQKLFRAAFGIALGLEILSDHQD